jgi:DNA (cytosine-5)-methyltransferase 1
MNVRPKLLDLFCGAGGAAMGYHRAGFRVCGIDIKYQRHYPFSQVTQDALSYAADHGSEYDVIHASPPCQAYTRLRVVAQSGNRPKKEYPALINETRNLLISIGRPWVIENVCIKNLNAHFMLCGSMFGLGVNCDDGIWRQLRRHRYFESSLLLLNGLHCKHDGSSSIGVYGHGGYGEPMKKTGQRCGYQGRIRERSDAMGIDWMSMREIAQAIPPAYTEYIGKQFISVLKGAQ